MKGTTVSQECWGIVVDDRPKQAEAIADALTNWGVPSKGFMDPDEALRFAESHRGSVVFAMFDVCLGEKSGIAYARVFREKQLSNEIVLVTGYQDTITAEDAAEMKKLGVSTLDKSIDLESLFAQKLSAWRSITRQDIDQQSVPNVISAMTASNDEAVAAVTHAITKTDLNQIRQKMDDLSGKVEYLRGRDEGRDHQEVVGLAKKEVKAGRNGWIVGGVGVLVAIVFGVLAYMQSQQTSTPPSTLRMVIAEGMQPVAAPVYVAYEKHFWKDLGLDVELIPFTSGRLCLDAVLAGKAEAGTMAETPIMNAGFQGVPIFVVAGIHKSQKNTKVIARRNKGITKPFDLKGHAVAVSIGTNGEFFMDQFLKRSGLTRKDLQVVNLQPEDMAASLIRGDVDACFTWEPHVQNVKRQLGDGAVIFENDGIYTETYNIVIASFVKSKQKELNLFLQGLVRAIKYMRENPDESIGIVSRRISMDADLLKAIWTDYTFELSLEQSFLDLLNEQAKWLKTSGNTSPVAEIPNYRLLILPEPLRAVKPDAVTVK
jgi:ABC-type nitrate/sulfonate/bicarbonate transport system substrate-binding protein/ActR/RegA family two-component response regulator